MNEINRLGFRDFSTFLKKKDKETINGKRKVVRSYKIVDNFNDIRSVLKFFDNLQKGEQGDILIKNII
jgi:hypothetical protein